MPLSPILPYIYIHINQIKIHFYDTGSLSKWSHLKKKKKKKKKSDGWDSQPGPLSGNDVMLLLFQEEGTGKHWTASTTVFMI